MTSTASPYTRLVSSVLFPLHERLKGHQSHQVLRHLEQTQWWPAERLEAYRLDRLRAFLARTGRTVPHYRELFARLGFGPSDVRSLADLRRLPLSDKAVIREHGEAMKGEGVTGLIEQRTSGSTGEPLRFFVGKERISWDVAVKWRGTRWWGVDVGDREAVIWGSPIELGLQDRLRIGRDRMLRSRLLPIIDISTEKLDRYLDEIRRMRPAMLFGYPSAMAQLAHRARERGLDVAGLGIRVAFVTSEMLRPHWRRAITEVFGCPVADEYGARDAGYIARECPDGGLHITAEYMVVEILDEAGQPVPEGQPGEVVLTNLSSAEFPVLRYRTGDIAALDPRTCPCRRALPLIREVVGRTNECLLATSGALVHDSALNYVIRSLEDVRAYKIVQETRDYVRVSIVAGPGFREDSVPAIQARYRALLGSGVTIAVERVTDIPREPTGKYRHVVSRVAFKTGGHVPCQMPEVSP